jgi:hypothetical protein
MTDSARNDREFLSLVLELEDPVTRVRDLINALWFAIEGESRCGLDHESNLEALGALIHEARRHSGEVVRVFELLSAIVVGHGPSATEASA